MLPRLLLREPFRIVHLTRVLLLVVGGVLSVMPAPANNASLVGAPSTAANTSRSEEEPKMRECSTRQLRATVTVNRGAAHFVIRVRAEEDEREPGDERDEQDDEEGEACQSEVSAVTYDVPDVGIWPQHRRAISTGRVKPGQPFVVDLELGLCRWQWVAIKGSDAPATLTTAYFSQHGTLIKGDQGGQPCQPTETATPTPTASPTPSPTATATPTSPPNCAPPPAGMVGWWPGNGDGNDIVGGHHGALRAGATFAPGLVGQAFSLDGVDDFVEIPDSPSFTLSSITIDAWVKPNVVVGTLHPIVAKYNASLPNGASWSLLGATNGDLVFAVYQTVSDFRAVESNTPALTPGVWQHLAATFDGGTQVIMMYVNGVEIPSTLVAGSTTVVIDDSAALVDIGTLINAQGVLNGLWDGLADEVEIFDRALSVSEVQAIYQAGSSGKCRASIPAAVKLYLPVVLQNP